MDDKATQPATQLMDDPRRYGQQNSGMTDEDLTDIFCILHPITLPACVAAALIHQKTPEHTINPATPKANRQSPTLEGEANPIESPGSFDLAAQGITSCDLALRLSSIQKDPQGGFLFGRHGVRCDFELGADDPKRRISNIHFRIYIMEHGVIMLEDSSTNGTLVDNTLLRAKNGNGSTRRTIDNGSIISFIPTVAGEEVIKFVVRIPQREGEYEDMFNDQLHMYLERLKDAKRRREPENGVEKPNGAGGLAGEAPDIFAKDKENAPPPTNSIMNRERRHKQWLGGEKYKRLDAIGKGAFATVYMLTKRYDGTPYACKELEKRRFIKNGVLDQKVENEMKIMSRIRHPNIVQFIEHVDYYEYLYLIMEFVPQGDLGNLIAKDRLLTEIAGQTMSVQILSALEYLHASGITHRDIKPDNILIQSLDPFHVKLTDFGLSKMIEDEETFLRTFCGTLLYCAPEVYTEYREYDTSGKRAYRGHAGLRPPMYNNAVDIWSFGAVLFYSISGLPPFPAKNGTTHQELLNRIMTKQLDTRPLYQVKLSANGISFIAAMLSTDPKVRATIDDCKLHKWLDGLFIHDVPEEELDEVDMVGEVADNLEQSASQLSIHERGNVGFEESMEDDDLDNVSTPQAKRDSNMEIPSSFPSEENSSSGDSFAYTQTANGRGRLFGEIDPAALRSSGVIAPDHLNLPLTSSRHFSQPSDSDYIEDSVSAPTEIIKMQPPRIPARELPNPPNPPRGNTQGGAMSDLSLFGAESMVGHLVMGSPSPAATNASSPPSPSPAMPPQTGRAIRTEDTRPSSSHGVDTRRDGPFHSMTSSIIGRRRSRDDAENVDPRGQSKRPATSRALSHANTTATRPDTPLASTEARTQDEPFDRRVQSKFTEKLMWDPRDRSTHVFTGQTLTPDEYAEFREHAAAKGEKAYSNSPSFKPYMEMIQKRRSASAETEAANRAVSEPIARHFTTNQHLGNETIRGGAEIEGPESHAATETQSMFVQATTKAPEPSTPALKPVLTTTTPQGTQHEVPISSSPFRSHPMHPPALPQGNTSVSTSREIFVHPSPNALARMTSTSDSSGPSTTFEIVSPVSVWGRGFYTNPRYRHKEADLIPKYAFKLALWGPDRSNPTSNYQNARFYLAAKRFDGIIINNFRLRATDPNRFDSASVLWAEIRHGDILTVGVESGPNPSTFYRLRFECFIGPCKVPRAINDEEVRILPVGEEQEQLDEWVIKKQDEIRVWRDSVSRQHEVERQQQKEAEEAAARHHST